MSRLTGPFDIPTVALQPSAAPIALNVLPAPGQQLAGNTTQQLAEALSVFNSGLAAFGKRVVDRDNQMALRRGQTLDFSDVFERGDHLNKNFRQIVADMGLPDSANPYFLVGAETNYGTFVASKVRNGVRQRIAELSNPDLSIEQQSSLLSQIIDEETSRWGGNRLSNNFYAGTSFQEALGSFLPELEREIGGQYLQNREAQALNELGDHIAEYLKGSPRDPGGDDRFAAEMNAKVMSLQRHITDPNKVRSILYSSVVTAFQSARNEEDIEAIEAVALGLPYGQGTVADSMGLRAQIAAARDRAERDVESRADQEERQHARQVRAAERDLSGKGVLGNIIDAVRNGEDPLQAMDKGLESIRENTAASVFDEVRARMLDQVNRIVSSERNISRDDTALQASIIRRITTGDLQTVEQVLDITEVNRIDPMPYLRYFEAQAEMGQRAADFINREAQVLITDLTRYRDENASDVPFDQMALWSSITDRVLQAHEAFIRGESTLDGKTFSEYRAMGKDAADAAIARVRKENMERVRKEERERLDLAVKTQRERVTMQASTETAMTRSEKATTPSAQKEHVEATANEIRQMFAPLYDPFNLNINGSLGEPSRFADTLSRQLARTAPFDDEIQVRSGDPDVAWSTARFRTLSFDGNFYRIYRGGGVMGMPFNPKHELMAEFTPEQLGSMVINLKMQRLSGFSVKEVLDNNTGVMDIPFTALKGKGFDWANVPVFDSFDEFTALRDGAGYTPEQKDLFYKRVIGTQYNQESIAAFESVQLRLLNEREAYRRTLR